VSTSAPGDGGRDALSSGRDEPAWWERYRVVVLAAVCLLAGGLVGLRLDSPDPAPARGVLAATGPAVDLQAGVLEQVERCTHRCLRLPVFNGGRRPVRVRAVAFADWRVRMDTDPALVPPGSWANVRLGLVADCRDPRPSFSGDVQVQASAGGRLRLLNLALPHPVDVVQEEYDRHCPVGATATPQSLRGVWVLERSTGYWADLAGSLLMRFAADGSFAWDSTGHLLDLARSPDGRYQVDGRRITLMVDTLSTCPAGGHLTWRATLTAPDRLNLVFLRGGPRGCVARGDEIWLARRLLLDHRLPEMLAAR
jgi:hypothetical protein